MAGGIQVQPSVAAITPEELKIKATPTLPPLMAGGILAGFMTSFMTAAVELSATILLSSAESQAPMSYGIYLYMQSIAGRGPGAALGIVAIAVVALGTYFSHRLLAHNDKRFEQRAAIQLSSL